MMGNSVKWTDRLFETKTGLNDTVKSALGSVATQPIRRYGSPCILGRP